MLKLFLVFFKYLVKEKMEYRAAFLMGAFAQMLAYGANYLVVWMLMLQFETLNGWTWPEIAFLYSIGLFTYALGASFTFVQMSSLEWMIRDGSFDGVLVKPVNPFFYYTTRTFNTAYIAHIALSGTILVWSMTQIEIEWNLLNSIYFFLFLISGGFILAAMMTIIGSLSFIIIRANFLFSLFHRLREFISYPLTLYGSFIQVLLIFIVPLGFVNFVPSSYLLDKPVPFLGNYGFWIAPLVGPVFFWLAYKVFMYGINKYQGAGG